MRGLIRSALVRVLAVAVVAFLLAAFVGAASAATIVKANNSTSLSAGTSWVGGIAPGILDAAQWNSTVTGSNTTTLGTGFYLGEISILNPGGPVTVNADGNTLGLYGINGTGIDMSNATQNLTLNCPILLGSTQTWNVASTQALSVGGVISGNFGLNLAGSGSIVLTGNNTFTGPVTVNGGTVTITGNNAYTGGTTISSGTLQVGGAGVLGGGNYAQAITNGGALVMNTSSNQTFSGVISGSGALCQLGSGELTMNAISTYTGPTTVCQGILQLSNTSNLPSDGLYASSAITVNSDGEILVNQTNALQGNASTAGSLAINSGGLVTTSDNVTSHIRGPLVLSGGTLASGAPTSSYGSWSLDYPVTVNGDTTSTMSGIAMSWSGTQTFTVNNPGGILYVPGTFAGATSVSSGFALNMAGSGTMILAGSDTYTGATTINGGTLEIGGTGVLGGGNYSAAIANSGALVVNTSKNQTFSGVISGNGALYQNGSNVTTLAGNNSYTGKTMIGGGTLAINGAGVLGSNNYTAAIANSGALVLNTGSNQTFSGVISGDGALYQLGSGLTTLTGADTYTGGTTIGSGTLAINGAGVLGGGNYSAAVSNSGSLVLNSSSNQTFSGVISGKGALYQNGSNVTTLTGSNNYTGGTTVSAGTLMLNFSQAGAPTNNIINSVSNSSSLALGGGTLAIQGNLSKSNSQEFNGLAVNQGCSAIVLTAAASNSLLLSLGNISRNAGSTIDFTLPGGTPSVANGITTTTPNTSGILGGYATVSGTDWASATGTAGNITAYAAYTQGDLGSIGSGSTLNVSPTGTQSAIASTTLFNTLNLTGSEGVTMSGTGSLTLVAGGLIGNTSGAVSGGTLAGSASGELIVITPQNLTIGSVIANNGGTTGLTKAGAGTLTLSGGNTYSGVTTIGAGTLQVGDGGASGTLGTGAVTDNGALVFNLSGIPTFSAVISGSGSLAQASAGVLTLLGSNTYTGSTTISAGTLQVSGSGSLGTGTVTNNGALVFSLFGNLTFSPVISGRGNLTQAGPGFLTLLGNNTYSGGTTLAAGELSISASNNLGAAGSPVTFNGGTLQITGTAMTSMAGYSVNWSTFNGAFDIADAANVFTVGNSISDGSLGKLGAGTLLLTASNNYGSTLISAGTLQLSGTGTLGTGVVTNNSALVFNLSGSPTFSPVISGSGNLTQAGPGFLTLLGNNTYTGSTAIVAGTLQVGNGGSGASIGSTSGVSIASYATLAFNHTDAVTFAPSISGNGNLINTGSGLLTLTGVNSTYTGGTTISSGTVSTGGTALGTGSVNLAPGTTLAVTANSGLTGFYYLNSPTIYAAWPGYDVSGPSYFNSLSTFQSHLATVTPSLIAQSNSVGGTVFSMDLNGEASGFPATVRSDNQYFEAVFTGTIKVANSGTYTFGLNSDDGSMIYIDGNTVVSNNNFHPENVDSMQQTATITLSAGYHQIAIGYYEGDGPYGLQAYYDGVDTGGSMELIPNSALTPDLTVGSLQGSGNVQLTAAGLYTGSDNTNQTFSGVISGVGGVTKMGDGTWTLLGANTYTGGTVVSAGTLRIGSGTAGSIVGNVMDNATLVFNRSDNPTFAGVISGNGNVIQAGPGILTLLGSNTFSGGMTISAGSLQLGNGGSTGGLAGYVGIYGTLVLDRSDNWSMNNELFGTGGLVKTGGDVVTLTGNLNGFSGPITIAQGQLVLTTPAMPTATAAYTASSGGTLAFQNATFAMNSGSIRASRGGMVQYSNATITNADLFGPGTQVLSASTTNTFVAVTVNAGTVIQQNGPAVFTNVENHGLISGSGGLVLAGGENGVGGTLTLGGDTDVSSWDNAGTITIQNGGLLNNHGNDLTSGGGSQITINSGGTLNADSAGEGVALDLNGGLLVNNGTILGTTNVNYGATVTGSGSAGLIYVSYGGVIAVSGSNNMHSSSVVLDNGTITGNGLFTAPTTIATTGTVSSSAALTLACNVSGAGQLVETGQGTVIVTGSDSYQGGTAINAGTLQLGNSGSLPNAAPVTVNGTLDLATFSVNVSALTGSGTVNHSGTGSNTLTVDSGDFTGTIENSGGTLALLKTGNGQLILSGSDSFSGGTMVEAGTLYVTNSDTLPKGTSLRVDAGGTFIFDPAAQDTPLASEVQAVPEPSTFVLLAVGVIGALSYAWRRRRQNYVQKVERICQGG